MIVNVEQKHIDQGKIRDCWQCPISLAIKDQYGTNGWVGVTLLQKEDNLHCDYYSMPEQAQLFIDSFDNGYPV